MTTANKVTIARILLIPFFVIEVLYYRQTGDERHRLLAVLAFGIAAICDAVDGYIARRYNQRSELGAILDPLADKLLLLSAIVLFSIPNTHLGVIPLWLTGTIIGRDLLLLIGLVVIQFTVGKVIVRPRFLGKVSTVLQMLCVVWIILKWDTRLSWTGWHGASDRPLPWFTIWAVGAAVCTGISGLYYLSDGVRQLSSHPTSSAAANQTRG